MAGPYYTDDEPKIDEVIRQAESFIAGQLTAAIAADQRALTFAGLLVAGVAAMIGAVASMQPSHAVIRPLIYIAACLLLAALAALWSARPTKWHLPGNEPQCWLNDIQTEHDPMLVCKADTAEIYQSMIDDNKGQVEKAKWAMRFSMTLTAITLGTALVWLLVHTA